MIYPLYSSKFRTLLVESLIGTKFGYQNVAVAVVYGIIHGGIQLLNANDHFFLRRKRRSIYTRDR